MSRQRKLIDWLLLPLELMYDLWIMPDEFYEGKEHDLICTLCYIACKVLFVFVCVLIVWLTICPLFGF